MVVNTLFRTADRLRPGEVEIKLLPGIPHLHVVGLPDASIKECGIKLKSALRSRCLKWPLGHQVVVNLRPASLRKHGSGVELAIAIAFLGASGQLPETVRRILAAGALVYGEIDLNGEVRAPADVARALREAGERGLVTGPVSDAVREGNWWEMEDLAGDRLQRRSREFDWRSQWQRPGAPDVDWHPSAALGLILASHLRLNVLLAGPQGSGKSTWARTLHALLPPPDPEHASARANFFGERELEERWRPCEQPHHSLTVQAMVGGGSPISPGVITRAHGGLLIMDEFLEFPAPVLESLREPMETGNVVVARTGDRVRFPASFQLVGTTNLCPCGRLDPTRPAGCKLSLTRCRSVCFRLSGPVMDRFDLLVMTHQWRDWTRARVSLATVRETRDRLAAVGAGPGPNNGSPGLPASLERLDLSLRRRHVLLKVARALADLEGRVAVGENHMQKAYDLAVSPMEVICRLFA